MKKTYIGDGVYLEDQDWHWALTAENGREATDTIYLEKSHIDMINEIVNKKETK